MKWAGHVEHMRERRGVYRVLVGKPEGKRPLGRPRSRREYLDGSSGNGMWDYGLDKASSGSGQLAGTCDCGNEHFFSRKIRGISCLAENVSSQEGLCFME